MELDAFLNCQDGPMIRIFKASSYFNKGSIICIAMDASIYGMGAVLFIDRVAVEFFAIRIDKNDEKYLEAHRGDKDPQQVWESMVLLVAVKHWLPKWQKTRMALQLQSDNIAALTLASQLKASGARRKIAKELALVYSQATFEPDLVTHIPGVMNVTPDSLSRRFQQPDWHPPAALKGAKEVFPAKRNATWWMSRSPPSTST